MGQVGQGVMIAPRFVFPKNLCIPIHTDSIPYPADILCSPLSFLNVCRFHKGFSHQFQLSFPHQSFQILHDMLTLSTRILFLGYDVPDTFDDLGYGGLVEDHDVSVFLNLNPPGNRVPAFGHPFHKCTFAVSESDASIPQTGQRFCRVFSILVRHSGHLNRVAVD